VYLPQLDTLLHLRGSADRDVASLLARLDGFVESMAGELAGKARLVVMADHGQTDVPRENLVMLGADDPSGRLLSTQPSGEARVPYFHVSEGSERVFAGLFRERYGQLFALLTPAEVEELQLLGPGPIDSRLRPRLGSFVGISPVAAKVYAEPFHADSIAHVGAHGGLLPAEMRIPLVVV
jgi:hypothetical protein